MFLCRAWSATTACPCVQTDRLFPTASFALSSLSPCVSRLGPGNGLLTKPELITSDCYLSLSITHHTALALMRPCSERDPCARPQQGSFEGGHHHCCFNYCLYSVCYFPLEIYYNIKRVQLIWCIHTADRKISKFWTKVGQQQVGMSYSMNSHP